ncbi:hypothetical protein HH214_05400 [Mucilaginibacter robiniae]|uniref:TonB C-terminal domain-containing protein n=1 Tax=Mucilaginibacter robiniae TaxID=2728022 RepID=A0A7L5E3J5_9SPHI|nr:energy transducer TonB [Mucilaginibacter robiniae]QJD95343.1 hypothetical protein HH214_05400 [Mucilaginibacter robiniae]
MSAKKTDISQIRKYLNGELDAHAMHKLEKQALNDPFLMDALEGYEQNDNNQQQHLTDLYNRLQQRVQPAKQRLLWPRLAAAASIILFIAVGCWWLLHQTSTTRITLPSTGSMVHIPIPSSNVDSTVTKSKQQPTLTDADVSLPTSNNIAQLNRRYSRQTFAKPRQSPLLTHDVLLEQPVATDSSIKGNLLNEVAVIGYSTQKKTSITGSIAQVQAQQLDEPVGNAPVSRIAGVNILNSKLYRTDTTKIKTITGKVTDESGSPLPGVVVKVEGVNTNVTTNADGNFSIKAQKNDQLNIAYLGFEPIQLKVKDQNNLQVTLKPTHMSLSEVAVTGYGTSSNIITKAHPVTGWKSFKQYLANQAHVTDSSTGKVRVSFMVNADNSLTDFIIIKSLSQEADQEAIRLIKEGPSWLHNLNDQPEKVTLTIRFTHE